MLINLENQNATLGSITKNCILYCNSFQRVVAGLKPSFSVDFAINESYFVSNMVVVLVAQKWLSLNNRKSLNS